MNKYGKFNLAVLSIKVKKYTYEIFLSLKYYVQIFMVHVTKITTLSGVGHV